jgi:hypothetical protein
MIATCSLRKSCWHDALFPGLLLYVNALLKMFNLYFVCSGQAPALAAFQKHVVSSSPCGAPRPRSTGPGGRGSGVGHLLLRTRLGFIPKLHSMCCSRFSCHLNFQSTGTASPG